MHKRFGSSLQIELSRHSITLLHLHGWLQRKRDVLASTMLSTEDVTSQTQLVALLDKLLQEAKCGALPTSIIVADELTRIFIVTPPKNGGHLEDYRAAADMRFLALYGEAVSDWQIEANWNATHPFLACALQKSLCGALQQIAAKHQLTLTRIVPHFIATWNLWHRSLMSDSWFCFIHDGHLTLSIIDQQQLCGVRTIPLSDNDSLDLQWLSDTVNCEALRLNLSTPISLQVSGELPAHWMNTTIGTLRCHRLGGHHPGQPKSLLSFGLPGKKRPAPMRRLNTDFAPRSLKRTVLLAQPSTWLFGVIGLMLCTSAAFDVYRIVQQRNLLATDIQRIQTKQAERIVHFPTPQIWTITDAQANAVTSAIDQLNLPWRDVLDAIEVATPTNIALLSIEPDAKKQVVKGMAEAKTSYEMLAYIEQLKKQEFFGMVILTKHEINEQDMNKPYRFQFEAQWAGESGKAQ